MLEKNTTINFFCHVYLPQTGGIERYTANFSDELVKLGYKVNIITTNSHNLSTLELDSNKIIYRLNSIKLLGGRFPIPYSINQFYKIYKHFLQNQESIIVLNSRLFLTSLVGLILGKLSGNKVILIEHGSGHIQYSNEILTKIFAFYEHLVSMIYRVSKIEFYGVSKASNKWLKHFNINALGTINNGIRPVNPEPSNLLKKYNLEDKKSILFVGRLIHEKGIIELIEAFKIFNKNHKDYQLIIVGGGELETKVKFESLQNKDIHFLGKQTHDNVLNLMENSIVYINPSNYAEGLPTTILEAAYFGTPVISTPNGGAKEVINSKTGILIESSNVKNILNALSKFSEDESIYFLKSLKTYKLIDRKYIWTKIAKNFIKNISVKQNQQLYFKLDLK